MRTGFTEHFYVKTSLHCLALPLYTWAILHAGDGFSDALFLLLSNALFHFPELVVPVLPDTSYSHTVVSVWLSTPSSLLCWDFLCAVPSRLFLRV